MKIACIFRGKKNYMHQVKCSGCGSQKYKSSYCTAALALLKMVRELDVVGPKIRILGWKYVYTFSTSSQTDENCPQYSEHRMQCDKCGNETEL